MSASVKAQLNRSLILPCALAAPADPNASADAPASNKRRLIWMAMQISRRLLLAGASALAFGSAGAARAQGKIKLRFSCAFTEADMRAEAYKTFAAAIKDDFDFEPYWNN